MKLFATVVLLAAACARSEEPARLALRVLCFDAEHGARVIDPLADPCPASAHLKIMIGSTGSKRRHLAALAVRLDGTIAPVYPQRFGEPLPDLPSELIALPTSPQLEGAPVRLVLLAVADEQLSAADPLLTWAVSAPAGSSHDVQGRADAIALDVPVLEIRR